MSHSQSQSLDADDGNRLLSTDEAAAYTPYNARTLVNLRSAGKGPAFIKVRNGAVAYRLRDLVTWQTEWRRSTLDQD
ncbi:helix-turn-helix transcriptional regulator [Nakamurella lactea]|uniref:helix-turn-helix transcriptional regulator n=1 Tax=Nakamurella lactea TaxID=459515 RepID=UPI00048E68C6|nr:helix-turn-helix domain-containing protein [Nakamurella lactea]